MIKLIILTFSLIIILVSCENERKGFVHSNEVQKFGVQFFFKETGRFGIPSMIDNPSDSFIRNIISRTPKLKPFIDDKTTYYWHVLKNDACFTDINGDGEMDMLLYIDGFWNGDGIEIYLSEEGILKNVFSQSIFQLSNIFKPITPNSVFYLSAVQFHYSSWPFLSSYIELTISSAGGGTSVNEHKTHFFEGTEFPKKTTINIPFKIVRNKYNLRKTPSIDDAIGDGYNGQKGNIILELAQGDIGVALAEKEDATGRLWWFVQVKNNVNKSLDQYYYIDVKGERQRYSNKEDMTINKPMFGWISSRFVEKINTSNFP